MLKRLFILILLNGLIYQGIYGQCSPSDCPMTLPPIGTVESHLDLSGALNSQLGQNAQHLRAVSLNIRHDAIDELDIVLIAPNGSSLSLSTFQGIQIGQNITFDICFFSCNESPEPDPGFPIIFESDAGYEQNEFYSGSYYPAEGCLEDLTGTINGRWKLKITDNFIQDGGKLLDWSLEFADNSGLNCVATCLPEVCRARYSIIGPAMQTYCENAPELNLIITPQFNQSQRDTSQFGYAYILVDPETGLIIDVLTQPDLRNFPPGTYLLYGLSYHKSDWEDLPAPNGQYAFHDLINDMSSGELCLRPSDDYRWIQILPKPKQADLNSPPTICPGDTILYSINDFDGRLNYEFNITGGAYDIVNSTDSTIQLVWSDAPNAFELHISSVCDTLIQRLNVPLTNMPQYRIDGPSLACPGDTVTYIISGLSDPAYQLHFEVNGGKLLSSIEDTLQILWTANQGENQICSYLSGPICTSQMECMNVNIPDPREDLIHISNDSLCPGSSTWVWLDSSFQYNDFEWQLSGASILSKNDDSLELSISEKTDSARLCIQFRNECGDTSTLCKDIFIRKAPRIQQLQDQSTCNPAVFIQSQLTDTDSIQWKQLDGPSDIFLPSIISGNTLFELDDPGNYIFSLYAFNEECTSSDTLEIRFHESPDIVNVQTVCELDSFTLDLEIQNGTLPFIVNGDTIHERYYSTSSYPSGGAYQLNILDANQCATELSGTHNCPCVSYAEHEDTTPLTYCLRQGEQLEIPVSQNVLFDGNDSLLYIIHANKDDVFGTEILRSGVASIPFSTLLKAGREYYVSLVIGNKNAQGIDLSDSCTYVSAPLPFTVYIPSSIDLSDTLEACMNSIVEVIIRSEAEYPLEITLESDKGQNKKVRLEKQEQTIEFEVAHSIENWSVQNVNAPCSASIQENLQLRGILPPTLDIKPSANLCVTGQSVDTFDLNYLYLKDPNTKGYWSTTSGLKIADGSLVILAASDTGIYSLQFTPEQNTICELPAQNVALTIESCDCIQLELPPQLAICNLKNRIHLPERMDLYIKGSWEIENINSIEDPPVVDGPELLIDYSGAGEYVLRFTPEAENVYCSEAYSVTLRIEDYLSAGTSMMAPSYCQESGMELNLFEMVEDEDPNGKWYWLNNEISSVIQLDSFTADIHTFTYMHAGTDVCPPSQTRLNIEVVEKPEFAVQTQNVRCFGESNGEIEITGMNDLYAPYTFLIDGQASQSNPIEGLPAGNYTIQVLNYKGCSSETQEIEIMQPTPLKIDLGPDIEVFSGNPFFLELGQEDSEHEIVSLQWYENGTQIDNALNQLEYTVFEDSYIWVLAIDERNCQTTDSVWVEVKNKDVEIDMPNVINPRSPVELNQSFGLGKVKNVAWIESIQIFDRWGNQLFIQRDVEPGDISGYWDGTVDGEYMQEGVYVYSISYKTTIGERKILKGDVSILY